MKPNPISTRHQKPQRPQDKLFVSYLQHVRKIISKGGNYEGDRPAEVSRPIVEKSDWD